MIENDRPIYLDCASTTPVDPQVKQVLLHHLEQSFGNAGSRTHFYGHEAAKAVKQSRDLIAAAVEADPEEIIFTSGATEANNLAILGLMQYGKSSQKRHILSTSIEHKAVLQPLKYLETKGFEVELIGVHETGVIDPSEITKRLRNDTLLVSVMHVNNETGLIQPIGTIADALSHSDVIFHTDAAQGFAKHPALKHPRIDLISASGHKICGPKGIGCLIARRSRKTQRKLCSIQFGGDQERGLRPGTLPVALIAAFGVAAELLEAHQLEHQARNFEIFSKLRNLLVSLGAKINGLEEQNLGNCINFSIHGLDSEFIIHALKDLVAISNGSACTSEQIEPSHVIQSMFNDKHRAHEACRLSWCHLTPDVPYALIERRIRDILGQP